MLTENIHTKTFTAGEASIKFTKDDISGKMSVKFAMPTSLTSVTQINEMILLLQEAKKEIEVDIKRKDPTQEPISEHDSPS